MYKKTVTKRKTVRKSKPKTKKVKRKIQKGGVTGISDLDRKISKYLDLPSLENVKKISKADKKIIDEELKKRDFNKKILDKLTGSMDMKDIKIILEYLNSSKANDVYNYMNRQVINPRDGYEVRTSYIKNMSHIISNIKDYNVKMKVNIMFFEKVYELLGFGLDNEYKYFLLAKLYYLRIVSTKKSHDKKIDYLYDKYIKKIVRLR